MSEGYCTKHVFSGERWDFGGHRCGNKAVKDGLCRIHQPEYVASRKAEAAHRDAAKQKAERELRARWAIPTLREMGYTVISPGASGGAPAGGDDGTA